ncbi:metallophosphoesterase [Sulfuricurvum sp.]|uniref:metallophosphoesterase family protein n=1 Tax=Sulfuricurvum sp. TaxID=2025608 RepID=UPI0026317102|nr:metallophosphoesterase [Sulfuricurvum sp.]MDD3596612.1 metallophosphoesterase [Sulfuricurvum sp.]
MGMREDVYRIAILSDLHVNASDSRIRKNMPEDKYENPFTSLKELINKEQLDADLLICCGDMADRAEPGSLEYAWKEIHLIANSLKASHVLGTVGNHDVDSRFATNEYDPKVALQSLSPVFPGIDDNYSNHFWAKHFAITEIEDENIQILNINSCAYHGYQSCDKDKNEYEHGRISQQTLNQLESVLEKRAQTKKYEINIAFFHHHPNPRTTRQDLDYSHMDAGDRLLQLLSKDYGRWLIIHGHKHASNIVMASGNANQPIIFSAGSFSSTRSIDIEQPNLNQFYIIELVKNSKRTVSLPRAGSILTWNLNTGNVWNKAIFGDGIPYGAGFGNTADYEVLAGEIDEFLTVGVSYDWEEVVHYFPKLKYTMPETIKKVLETLRSEYYWTVRNDPDTGWPSLIFKKEPANV